jgi:cathepsin X
MGFFRVELGKNLLMIESNVAWATPGTFSTVNYPCFDDGANCLAHHDYIDPSNDMVAVQRRLRETF